MRATLSSCICLLAFATALQPLTGAQAADDEFTRDLTTRTIVVGVKEAPPFSMNEADGTWSGISVELWKRVASDLHVQYRFAEEPTVQALLDKTQAGQIDVAVAALTVTADRERNVDFVQPFFSTGLGVAVRTEAAISWTPVVRTLGSVGFLEAVGALVGLALTTGLAVWLLERRSNDDFAGGSRGLASGVWWSTLSSTTARCLRGMCDSTIPLPSSFSNSMFEPQTYAFAVPTGSPLRKAISISVLNAIGSEWWTQTRFRYFGANG